MMRKIDTPSLFSSKDLPRSLLTGSVSSSIKAFSMDDDSYGQIVDTDRLRPATSTVAEKSMTPQMRRKTWVVGSGRQSGMVKKDGHVQID